MWQNSGSKVMYMGIEGEGRPYMLTNAMTLSTHWPQLMDTHIPTIQAENNY